MIRVRQAFKDCALSGHRLLGTNSFYEFFLVPFFSAIALQNSHSLCIKCIFIQLLRYFITFINLISKLT